MGSDHRKIRAFEISDELVKNIYRDMRFPQEERFGLQSQIRRAAVSVPVNIVEGCQRKTKKDKAHFFSIAMGSAAEVAYLLSLCRDIGIGDREIVVDLATKYDDVVRMLNGLLLVLDEESQKQ